MVVHSPNRHINTTSVPKVQESGPGSLLGDGVSEECWKLYTYSLTNMNELNENKNKHAHMATIFSRNNKNLTDNSLSVTKRRTSHSGAFNQMSSQKTFKKIFPFL